MSGNSILHTGCIYFQDGTSMCTATNTGAQGSQGAQGPQGATGPQGISGSTGSMILSGYSNPTGGVGNTGDFYLNLNTAVLYGPKWGSTVAIPGGSMLFSGNVSTYLTINSIADTNFQLGTGDFTIEWFMYMNSNSLYPRVFSIGTYPSATLAVSVEYGNMYFWANSGGTIANINISTARWDHIAVVRNSGSVQIYQNGVQKATIAAAGNLTNLTSNLTIGSETTPASNNVFNGYITNFRWTKGTAVYTSNFTTPSAPLTSLANTKLLLLATDSSSTTLDSSSAATVVNNNGTNVQWNSNTPFGNAAVAWSNGINLVGYTGAIGATGSTGNTGPTGNIGPTGFISIAGTNYSDYVYWNGSVWSPGCTEVHLGSHAGEFGQSTNSIAIGNYAGQNSQGVSSVAIGDQAGYTGQNLWATAVGANAGQTQQGGATVAVGYLAGQTTQQNNGVAVGVACGQTNQGDSALAIGNAAGQTNQSTLSVAIDPLAGQTSQGSQAVAIGYNAGQTSQGSNSIAIGYNAGVTSQVANSIILNASGVATNPINGNGLSI